jgi:hypothetical protein
METIDLYKFVNDNAIEYHWHDNEVLLMVNCKDIERFNEILPAGIFDDDGVSCVMKDGYFVFNMEQICSYCDIKLSDIFPNESNI